jgi:hypothetical protein
MIDSVYQTVQGILNKDQLGYLKPLWFNLFAAYAQRKEYNKYFTDLKSNVRKMNWMLDGKDFANLSEHSQQLLEYFSTEKEIQSKVKPHRIELDSSIEFLKDVFYFKPLTPEEIELGLEPKEVRVEKVSYSDFKDLKRNKYVPPTECNPYCSKLGNVLKVAPSSISKVTIHYLRKPITPKWTFIDVEGVAMFNSTASDFQDFDLPETSYDSLIDLISEVAGIALRDGNAVQAINQIQSQDFQEENKQ